MGSGCSGDYLARYGRSLEQGSTRGGLDHEWLLRFGHCISWSRALDFTHGLACFRYRPNLDEVLRGRPHDVHAFAFCKIIQRRLEKVYSGYGKQIKSQRPAL